MPLSRNGARAVALALMVSLGLVSRVSFAQQAIVTMPSADITPARQFFAMHETQARAWGQRPYWAGTWFLTYGLGYETELAATLFDFGVTYDGGVGNTALALGFKSGVPLLHDVAPRLELRLTFGAMAMVSTVGRGVGHWLYFVPTLRIPGVETRVGAGLSHASEQFYGPGYSALSFIASIEQPVPVPGVRGLSIVAEWFSGSHELSNLIVGLTWHPTPRWIFVLGWKIPTRDAVFTLNEQAVVAEVGIFFPPLGRSTTGSHPAEH